MSRFQLFAILLFAAASDARDENYAFPIRVFDSHVYRLASLDWFPRLATTRPRFNVTNVPTAPMRIARLVNGQLLTRTVTSDVSKRRLVAFVADFVTDDYHRILSISRPISSRDVQVRFSEERYGQSRPDLLVTNGRVPWTYWERTNTEMIRFHWAYNQTEDLAYRFYHNIGHTFGFGHYVSGGGRSVMYANYADPRYSATRPLGVDLIAMPLIVANYESLLRNEVGRMLDVAANGTVSLLEALAASATT